MGPRETCYYRLDADRTYPCTFDPGTRQAQPRHRRTPRRRETQGQASEESSASWIALVWIGRAPNIAAKLSGIREGFATLITSSVFNMIADESKYGGNPRQLMWENLTWNIGVPFGVSSVYCSNWHWEP